MGRRRRPATAPDDDDDDDEDAPPAKKKKKKTKASCVEAPTKIGGLRPKIWTPQMLASLPPARRLLWLGESTAPQGDSEAARLARRRLGLRVPDVGRQPCRFWVQGRCQRGDACSFAHSAEAPAGTAPRCPLPIESLSDPGLPRCIGRAMIHLGFREPSPVQAQAWPAALSGHDLLCRAPTGSGKTLAYLLPAMAHALDAGAPPHGHGPAALVLVPTRELAMQVVGLCRSLHRPCGVHVEAVYGGEPREDQIEAMEGAVHMVVGTAGRLADLLIGNHVKLGRVGCHSLAFELMHHHNPIGNTHLPLAAIPSRNRPLATTPSCNHPAPSGQSAIANPPSKCGCSLGSFFVLDEADQLLTLGFTRQVSQIISQLRPDRQTLLVSATLSERLERMAGSSSWILSPIRIYADEVHADEVHADEVRMDQDRTDDRTDDGGIEGEREEEGYQGEGEGAAGDLHKKEAGEALGEALSAIPSTVEQRFTLCAAGGRSGELLSLLEELGHSVGAEGMRNEELSCSKSTKPLMRQPGVHQPGVRNAPRVMVFVNEIVTIRKLVTQLKRRGVRCEALHGERSQRERDESLHRFKAGAAPVLLASDLASRGMDIHRLPTVVNFDPPPNATSYIHRAGRTGRKGASGLVVTLLRHDAPSRHLATQVRGLLQRAGVPLPEAFSQLLPSNDANDADLPFDPRLKPIATAEPSSEPSPNTNEEAQPLRPLVAPALPRPLSKGARRPGASKADASATSKARGGTKAASSAASGGNGGCGNRLVSASLLDFAAAVTS